LPQNDRKFQLQRRRIACNSLT